MKRLVTLLVLLLSILSLRGQSSDPYARIDEGERLPAFEVTMTDGSTLTSADLEGKVVWICLWASWCPSCRKEFKWLNGSEEFAMLLEHPDFLFLPIAREENSATVVTWLRRKGYDFCSAADPERKVYDLFAEQDIPRNIVVGRDGIVVRHSSAYSRRDFEALIELTRKMLN